MKKNIKTLLLSAASLLAIGSSFTSCSKDFLDIAPSNQYTAQTFYNSDASVMKAIEPLYNYAWFNYNYRGMIGMGSIRANDGWNPYLNAEFATFQVTGLSSELANSWSAFYMVISMANQLIEDIDKYCQPTVSEEVKNLAIGEARLMRATAYFYLVRAWGDVIVYDDNVKVTSDPVQPLIKEEDVLKFIIRDYYEAMKLLPETSKNMHATKYTAEALCAKALLALSGWNKGTRDQAMLDEVVRLCNDVISCPNYDLMDNYEDLFKYEHNNFSTQNKETLLAMHFADPLSGQWGAMSANLSDLAWSGSTDITAWGGIYASVDMIDLYNEDISDSIRFKTTFCTPGAYYSYWDTGNDLVPASDKTPENGYPSNTGYVYKKKFCQIKKGIPGTKADCQGHLAQMATPLNTYIIRLADVYLTKAEALLGNAESTTSEEGRAAINEVRERAGAKQITKSYDLETIIKERRKEFCMEFQNWYDMVTWYRWKPQYMLNYFNNKQHRAFMINDGDVLYNKDRTISYRTFCNRQSSPWYIYEYQKTVNGKIYEKVCYWNDCMRDGDSEDVIMTKEEGYEYDIDKLCRAADGYDPVILNEQNIFMPYPEADVLRNPYFGKEPVAYDFGKDVENEVYGKWLK